MANNVLIGTEKEYEANKPHTQVYYATHDKPTDLNQSEWPRKDYMYRSFISFSFGGKWIEDFNLIAVVDGDRMQRAAYANFEDLTTEYEVVDGQYYWGTHMLNNQINFLLATDGITQRELDEFKQWFRPGNIKYLRLAEHPNREILARVSAPPVISVLPFEDKKDFSFGSDNIFKRKTSSTLYKGNISLSFTMDEPYWKTILAILDAKYYEVETNEVDENENPITKKEFYWDDANNNRVLASQSKDAIKIILEDGTPITNMLTNNNILFGQSYIANGEPTIKGGAHVEPPSDLMAKIGSAFIGNGNKNQVYGYGVEVSNTNTNLILNEGEPLYFYYPGNAPANTVLSFTTTIDDLLEQDIEIEMYDNKGKRLKKFVIGKPAFLIAMEQVKKVNNMNIDTLQKQRMIRDTVKHKRIRALALNSGEIDFNGDNNKIDFSFDSKTGKATVGIRYDSNNPNEITTENAGDCVKSEYLKIEGTDYFGESGLITPDCCHHLTTNTQLTNFDMSYTPMYM